jgi:large subunit ribosomal protein L25
LAKDVQRDPIKPVIDHVDLVLVRRDEKVTVDVPVATTGEAGAETVVTVDAQTVQLLVLATAIPEHIAVSVEGLAAGTQVLAAELELPEGAELVTDPEVLVVNVTQQVSAEALEAELAEAEAEAGIEHERPEEQTEGEAAAERETAAAAETTDGVEASDGS